MKRSVFIGLSLLVIPLCLVQLGGASAIQEVSSVSYMLLRQALRDPVDGTYRSRGFVTFQGRLNDSRNQYFREDQYIIDQGQVVPLPLPPWYLKKNGVSQQQRYEQEATLKNDVQEFKAEPELKEEAKEFEYHYDENDLGFVPEVGDVEAEDFPDKKPDGSKNSKVDIGGFNL